MTKPLIGIVMGSESDLSTMEETAKVLKEFGVAYEMRILSAHRTPDLAGEYSKTAASRGLQAIIAAAGMANHLAGAMAAHSILPIIGVPLDGSPLVGFDALMATVQMPAGVPVACVAVGKAGAKNAAHLALQILGLKDEAIQQKIVAMREKNKQAVIERNKTMPG